MADINGAEELSVRDSLLAAFEPESTAPDSSSSESVEAPAEQTEADEASAAQRARDEKGRFAPKSGEQPGEVQAPEANAQTAAAPNAEEPQAQTDPERPPPGWSPASKSAWHSGTIPPEVRRDIAKREEEINKGFAKLQGYKGLDPYIDMARQSGTTINEAMDRYIAAERFLEQEPVKAVATLAKNYGVDPRELIQALGFTDASAQPQNGAQQHPAAQQYQQPDLRPHLSPLLQKINTLEQMIMGDKQSQVEGQLQSFWDKPENRYADNVADQMVALIQSGQVTGSTYQDIIQKAYDTACWMNPEVRAEVLKEQRNKETADQIAKTRTVSDQAKRAGRSIAGSPSTPPAATVTNPDDLRATLEEQFRGASRI